MRGVAGGAFLGAALLVVLAAPAMAGIRGPCNGSVTIGGEIYGPQNDTPANPIVIPAEPGGLAIWEGRTEVVIKNHSGALGVRVGPGIIPLATWSGENADEETEAFGSYPIDQAKELLPVDVVGIYEVTGFHDGEGGSCEGSAMVKIEGNPLTTPIGAGSAAGAALSAAGVAMAARGRRS